MAKKSTARAKPSNLARVIPINQGPRNITITAPRPAAPPKKTTHRPKGGGGGGGAFDLVTPAAAGYLLGYIDKNPGTIPTIPMLGRAGTLALGCYMFRKHGSIAGVSLIELAKIFAGIAMYEFQKEGSISGPRGLAAAL